MKTFRELAGTYILKSPYHKTKKMLPFNVESDGYVSTVEYRGWQAYYAQGYYTIESICDLIEKGIIKEGRASFPRSIKTKDFY